MIDLHKQNIVHIQLLIYCYSLSYVTHILISEVSLQKKIIDHYKLANCIKINIQNKFLLVSI